MPVWLTDDAPPPKWARCKDCGRELQGWKGHARCRPCWVRKDHQPRGESK